MELPPLRKSYGGKTVLDFPGVTLGEGSVCAVIGANGSGKSTLARLLAGVIRPDSGYSLPAELPKVVYMPQKPFAFRTSVRKNVLLSGCGESDAAQYLEELGLSHLAYNRADRLSGGETARMALARALLCSFDLLILDEPTAAMDMESAAASEALIRRRCRETGSSLLLITHDLQQARRLADEAMFLREGRLVEHGPASELLYSPRENETKRFLEFYGGAAR